MPGPSVCRKQMLKVNFNWPLPSTLPDNADSTYAQLTNSNSWEGFYVWKPKGHVALAVAMFHEALSMFNISTHQLSYLTIESKNLSVGKCKTFQQQLKKRKVVISFLLSQEVKNISEFHQEVQQALGEKLSFWYAKYISSIKHYLTALSVLVLTLEGEGMVGVPLPV